MLVGRLLSVIGCCVVDVVETGSCSLRKAASTLFVSSSIRGISVVVVTEIVHIEC